MALSTDDLRILGELERKVLWLASWTIHNANHLRENDDGVKVGGHQASSASLAAIMTALYFRSLRPQDRVAVKPHASPNLPRHPVSAGQTDPRQARKLPRLSGGAQSYPSRTKDTDDVDFSTGSVGLGVAQHLVRVSIIQDYVHAHGWARGRPEGRMIALIGDAELDEGNIYEALLEGWKHGLRNCWWIIDYNRQSLDAVVREGLGSATRRCSRNFGWDVVILKYGSLQEAAFRGARRRDPAAMDRPLPEPALLRAGVPGRRGLAQAADGRDRRPGCGDKADRIAQRRRAGAADEQPRRPRPAVHLEAFDRIDHDRPTCFIAYTVKGFGLPIAGHKDNHAGLMTPAQMEGFRRAMNIRAGPEWDVLEGLKTSPDELKDVPGFGAIRHGRRAPAQGAADRGARAAFRLDAAGDVDAVRLWRNSERAGAGEDAARRAHRHHLAGRYRLHQSRPVGEPARPVRPREHGRHLRKRADPLDLQLGVLAEGPAHRARHRREQSVHPVVGARPVAFINRERLLPIGTLYDPFIARGLDALNYACYQDARFILVATPSGLTLAPEGGAHQSIAEPLIGLAQDGLAAFEPAFVDELAVIFAFALDYIQRDSDAAVSERNWLRDETGGSVYLRLSTRPVEQIKRAMTPELRQGIVDGAYWLREPGPNCQVVVAYTGAVAPEAIQAVGLMAEDRRDVGLLAVTSADRLNAGWTAALRARDRGLVHARSHIERLLGDLPPNCGIVSVLDGHPATLAWLGAVNGHRVRPLGVEHFGQTGSIADLYRHYGIDANAVVAAAQSIAPGRPIRHLRML